MNGQEITLRELYEIIGELEVARRKQAQIIAELMKEQEKDKE